MQVTVVPASPKTGRAVIKTLLNDTKAPTVRGVYRDLSRVPQEFLSHPNFKAVKGDISDAASLDFSGADAVFAITPPRYDDPDMVEYAKNVSENTKTAVRKAGTVKRLVLLSSIGAQCDHGTGEIMTSHIAENILKDAAEEVVFVRCAYFMENWASAIDTVKSEHPYFFSTITPLDYEVPMVAVDDIGQACAAQLLSTGSKLAAHPYIFELQGPRAYTVIDVQKAFQDAAGKEVDIKPVEKDQLAAFFSQFLPESLVGAYVEMTTSFLPGGIVEGLYSKDNMQRGQTELAEAIKRLYSSEH